MKDDYQSTVGKNRSQPESAGWQASHQRHPAECTVIIGLLGQGITMDEILKEYYRLTKEDILACLVFASKTLESNAFYPLQKVA